MKIRTMTQCALFAALLGVCAWISVPMGGLVVTLQTFGVFLALGLLGGRRGSLVCLVYLTMGMVGLPVFSGFRGGIGALLGPTGGYIWGFLAAALMYWLLSDRCKCKMWLAMAVSLPVCYLCGTVWYAIITQTGPWPAILTCVVPYLLPDAVKIFLALTLANKLRRFLLALPAT